MSDWVRSEIVDTVRALVVCVAFGVVVDARAGAIAALLALTFHGGRYHRQRGVEHVLNMTPAERAQAARGIADD